jgi:hypothetical protein
MKTSQVELKSYKDCIGNDVKVGDVITYPGRSGSSLWMNFGKVTKITKVKEDSFYNREYVSVQVLRPILMWHGLEPNNTLEGWKKVSLQCINRHVKLFGWQSPILKELFEKKI